MFLTYALQSVDYNYIYVGLTKNFDNRFERHNKGRERTTRSYRPFIPIFITMVEDRITARLIEMYLKSGSGKEFLKKLRVGVAELVDAQS